MDRVEPIRPSLGGSGEGRLRPVAPIDRRPREERRPPQQQPRPRPPRDAEGEHLLDEQA